MIPKRNRVDKKSVELIFKEGRFINSPNLTFKFIKKTGNTHPRISFIAPKSVAKKSTTRNLLRRRGYYSLKKHINKISPNIIGVFIFKNKKTPSNILESDISFILSELS